MVGNYRGAMHGIPYGAKDVFATAGIATTGHSKAYVDFVPRTDATAVAKLKRAGAVLLGQVTQAPIDLWPACPLSRFPAPKRLDARGATEEWSPAERPASRRAGSAKAGSSRPATPGHCRVAEDAAA